jgi:hypothetical protein
MPESHTSQVSSLDLKKTFTLGSQHHEHRGDRMPRMARGDGSVVPGPARWDRQSGLLSGASR